MLCLLWTILLLTPGILARRVPGPGDPDTYPYNYIKYEVSPGVIVTEDISGPPINVAVLPSQVKIYYYSSQQQDGQLIDTENPVAPLSATDFKKSRPTTFIVHGWKNDRTSPVCSLLKDVLITLRNVNVFVVDWGEIANKNYVTASYAVPDVGVILGTFIKKIVTGNGLDLDNTRIVGHSLGAHLSGFAGKTLNGKLDQIIGLDPAYPLYYYSKPAKRLSRDDAKFVQVMHTNGGLLGIPYSLGHSDYFPNGGGSQEGCFLDLTGECSHRRAYLFYEESLKSGNFVSTLCDDFEKYQEGLCAGRPRSNMGEYITDKNARGDYYLETNEYSPFAKGG